CAHHFRISAAERLRNLFDDGEWEEHFPHLTSNDPLKFTDTKPYHERLKTTIAKTGMSDAVIVATGQLDGLDVVIAAMEYALIGFAGPRVIEQTIRQKLPEGFQRSEFLLDHGMLDLIIDRREMKATLARALKFMGAKISAVEPTQPIIA